MAQQATARKRPATKPAQRAPAGSAQAVREREPVQTRTDILVKAIGRGDGVAGFYNLIRYRDGDTFFLNKEEDFSERWMVAVDANREEIPEETKRLAAIANADRRLNAGKLARERVTYTTERDPDKEIEQAEADLKKAQAAAPKRQAAPRRGEKAPAVDVGANDDPKRKIAGTDYERHEDVKSTDNQGPEPRGGRASDKSVV